MYLRGVESIVIGMAHRGRLNTLANICSKPMSQLFTQFNPIALEGFGSGDVKYHLGTHSEKLLERWLKLPRDAKSVLICECIDISACIPSHKRAGGPNVYHIWFIIDDFCRTKKKMLLAIMANSSHLEAIDPVIVGRIRAEQVETGDAKCTYRKCVIS